MNRKSYLLVLIVILLLIIGLTIYTQDNVEKTGVFDQTEALKDKQPPSFKQAENHLGTETQSSNGMQTEIQNDLGMEEQEVYANLQSYFKSPTPDGFKIASELLDDSSRLIASEAIDLLVFQALKGDKKEEVLEILFQRASDPTYPLRNQALVKAAKIGKEKVLPLVNEIMNEAESSADREERDDMYDMISRSISLINSPEGISHLKTILEKTKNSEIKENNYQTLATLATPEAISLLIEQADSTQGVDQTAVVRALARVEDSDTVNFLVDSVVQDSFSNETIAVLTNSPSAPEIFGKILTRNDIFEQKKIDILDTLAEYSPEGTVEIQTEIAEQMVKFIEQSDNVDMKAKALDVIVELRADNVAEILQAYLGSNDPALREKAFNGFLDVANKSNYSVLERFLWNDNKDLSRNAMVTMEKFMGKQDIKILNKATRHPDEFIRKHAKAILKTIQE